ncbi:hypothetical protein AURDEDRAFT_122292 [Auricularia subglabra TFB-10046 SS5]|nr:hypothetical protein AURDEDRAFT_122292 [Auricularia subglabra TFB-10046 SS5]
MANIVNTNSFAAIATTYSTSDEEDAAMTTRPVDAMQNAPNPASGDELVTTTRGEFNLTPSPLSSDGGRPTTPPPMAGVVRGRDDIEETPTAKETHAERTALFNAVNNRPRVAENDNSSDDEQIAIQQGAQILVPDTQLPVIEETARLDAPPQSVAQRNLVVGGITLPPRTRLGGQQPRRSLLVTTGHRLRQTSFSPSMPTIQEETANLGGGDRPIRAPRRPPSPPLPIKTEPLVDFQRRLQLNPNSRVNRSLAASPTPSTSNTRTGTTLALAIDIDAPRARSNSPQPAPRAGQETGTEADVEMDGADYPLPSPVHGAQPARSPSPDLSGLQPLEPRMDDVVVIARTISDRERAALAAVNPALAHSTIPFKGFGGKIEITGQPRRHFVRGLNANDISHYNNKPGRKGVFIIYAINGQPAGNFASNDQLGTLDNHLDLLYPYDNRLQSAKLHTSKDAPRGVKVLPNAIFVSGMSEGQYSSLTDNFFINVGGIQAMFHGWEPEEPEFATCVEGLRTTEKDIVEELTRDAMQTDAAITGCITRQALEDGVDAGALLDILQSRVRVESMVANRPRSSGRVRQWEIYVESHDLFSENNHVTLRRALAGLRIQHLDYGCSVPIKWGCRICLSITHPTGMCAATVLAGWRDYAAPGSAPNHHATHGNGGASGSNNGN